MASRQLGVVHQGRAETWAAACSQERTFAGMTFANELCTAAMEGKPSCLAEHTNQTVDTGWRAMQSGRIAGASA